MATRLAFWILVFLLAAAAPGEAAGPACREDQPITPAEELKLAQETREDILRDLAEKRKLIKEWEAQIEEMTREIRPLIERKLATKASLQAELKVVMFTSPLDFIGIYGITTSFAENCACHGLKEAIAHLAVEKAALTGAKVGTQYAAVGEWKTSTGKFFKGLIPIYGPLSKVNDIKKQLAELENLSIDEALLAQIEVLHEQIRTTQNQITTLERQLRTNDTLILNCKGLVQVAQGKALRPPDITSCGQAGASLFIEPEARPCDEDGVAPCKAGAFLSMGSRDATSAGPMCRAAEECTPGKNWFRCRPSRPATRLIEQCRPVVVSVAKMLPPDKPGGKPKKAITLETRYTWAPVSECWGTARCELQAPDRDWDGKDFQTGHFALCKLPTGEVARSCEIYFERKSSSDPEYWAGCYMPLMSPTPRSAPPVVPPPSVARTTGTHRDIASDRPVPVDPRSRSAPNGGPAR